MRALKDFHAYWMQATRAIGGTVDDATGIRLHAPQGGPPVNGILHADGLDLDAEIPRWKAKGAPFSVTCATDAQREACMRHGMEGNTPMVLVDVPVMDLGEPAHALDNDVVAFTDVQMEAHGIPAFVRDAVIAGWTNRVAAGQVELFVVHDDGPVGCAALQTSAGNAGMYAFGVLESHRRKGIGRSLAAACMQRARELGLEHAVAITTPDGLALSTALGAKGGKELQQFVWMPEGPPGA